MLFLLETLLDRRESHFLLSVETCSITAKISELIIILHPTSKNVRDIIAYSI